MFQWLLPSALYNILSSCDVTSSRLDSPCSFLLSDFFLNLSDSVVFVSCLAWIGSLAVLCFWQEKSVLFSCMASKQDTTVMERAFLDDQVQWIFAISILMAFFSMIIIDWIHVSSYMNCSRRDLLVIVDASKDDHYIKLSFFRDLICGKHLETWTEEAQNHGCLLDLPFAFVQDNFWLLICESSTFFYSSVIGFVSFEFIGELGCHLEIFSVFLLPLMMNIMKLSFFRDVPCGKPLETWTEEAQEPWAIICVPIPCRLGFLYNMRS